MKGSPPEAGVDPALNPVPLEGGGENFPDPVFILSPPLSYSSWICAMLGQHPQLYSLPETHLFLADTLREWWEKCSQSSFNMAHGLLRTVAEMVFGSQTEAHLELAGAWLRRRLPFTTGYLLEVLAEKAAPRALVEKSPSIIFHLSSMQRALRMFPQAKFIHLLQHPRRHCESVVKAIEDVMAHQGRVPEWLRHLANPAAVSASEESQERFEIDPQRAWLELNRNIGEFLEALPAPQKLCLRAEEILDSPDTGLTRVGTWLGLPIDADALDAMQHPERSRFAAFGPSGARYGDDALFLREPSMPKPPPIPDSLEGPFRWREDGEGFSPDVKRLARQYGYE